MSELDRIRDRFKVSCDHPGMVTIDESHADVPRLLAAVDAVLALHYEDLFRGHLSNGCKVCGGDWPCPTVAAITTAFGGDK